MSTTISAAPLLPKKKGWFRRNWIALSAAAVALVVGVAIGGAGAARKDAAPAPTVTVQAEAETKTVEKEVKDPTCREVAIELFSILQENHAGVTEPLMETVQILVGQVQSPYYDVSEIERGSSLLNEVSGTAYGLSSRIDSLSPEYQKCVG